MTKIDLNPRGFYESCGLDEQQVEAAIACTKSLFGGVGSNPIFAGQVLMCVTAFVVDGVRMALPESEKKETP